MKNWITTTLTMLMLVPLSAVAETSLQTLDLAAGKLTMDMLFDKKQDVKIKVTNLLPSKLDSYVVNIGIELINPSSFANPLEKNDQSTNNKQAANQLLGQSQSICDSVSKIVKEILELTEEKSLPDKLTELKSAAFGIGDRNCEHIYSAVLMQTQIERTITVERNRKYTVVVSYGDKELTKLVLTGSHKTWLTHVGFAFVDNKSEAYYSAQASNENDPATFAIEQAVDRDKFNYVAMAMFTYPFWDINNNEDWQLGLTAGLGTDAENIAVSVGLSLVVLKNFVITAGLVGTEFDVLKGQYKIGDNLGETSIDSTNLVDQTYKFSPAITFSFKFGGD